MIQHCRDNWNTSELKLSFNVNAIMAYDTNTVNNFKAHIENIKTTVTERRLNPPSHNVEAFLPTLSLCRPISERPASDERELLSFHLTENN